MSTMQTQDYHNSRKMSIFGQKEPPRDSRPSGTLKEAIMGCAVASPQSKTVKIIIIVKCQIYKEQKMGKKTPGRITDRGHPL
jgi:hypothetical protein